MSESINNNDIFNEGGIEEEKTPERGDIEDYDIESNNNTIENNNNNVETRKERISSDGTEVGAQQINQRAPQVNRRFFQGLASPSARQRNREERRRVREAAAAAAQTENGDNNEAANDGGEEPTPSQIQQCRRQTTSETVENTREPSRRTSAMYRSVAGRINAAIDRLSIRESVLIEAQLVEEEDDKHDDTPVYEAQKVGYMEQRCKRFAIIFSVVLVVLAVLMSVFIVRANNNNNDDEDTANIPSMQPTRAPTFDARPTLDIVRERGYIRCGFYESTLEHKQSVLIDLCHAISAVLFNSTDKIEKIEVTGANRFEMLQGRSVDLLLSRDTHTLEREVLEETTKVGFTFSVSVCNFSHDVHFIYLSFITHIHSLFLSLKSPYYYDGMSYLGNATFVECAEKEKRFGECATLKICVYRESTSYDYLHSSFPSDFYITMASSADANEMLLNRTCSVITGDKLRLLDRLSSDELKDKNYTVGEELKTKEPLSIVTRKGDPEFSDIINWVLQALFYGEEQGLTRDSTLCQNNTSLEDRTKAADLNYLNAVYCMGNYGNILYNGGLKDYPRGMNQINNGSSGMLYAIPFGDIENDDEDSVAVSNNGTCLCHIIRDAAKLNCGVVVPEDFAGDVTKSNNIVGMSVDYCRTLAAAIYNGDSDAVEFTTYLEGSNSSYIALNNGTIDVIAGTRIEKQYDFGTNSLPGVTFSTPFYFGNETAR